MLLRLISGFTRPIGPSVADEETINLRRAIVLVTGGTNAFEIDIYIYLYLSIHTQRHRHMYLSISIYTHTETDTTHIYIRGHRPKCYE